MTFPKVSVIVTTKNEAAHIGLCLRSIQKQTYSPIETIVIDNRSDDGTKQIARKYTSHVFNAGPERSAQRNFGSTIAKGKYLAFLDADMILTPWVIAQCVAVCNGHTLGAIIPEKSIGVGFWAKCKALERTYYEHVDWIESARFFRTDIFRQLGGYDESLTGPEDFEFPQRLKKHFGSDVIGRIHSYILHDEGHLSLAKLVQKKYYYGREMRRYSKLPESAPYFSKQSNLIGRFVLFARHPGRLMRDPITAIGMIFMKTAEMCALALGGIRG